MTSTLILQARQVLDREFSNLLAMGTDRRLDEVGQLSVYVLFVNMASFADAFILACVLPLLVELYYTGDGECFYLL